MKFFLKMQPYWKQEFVFDEVSHLVELYQYSSKCNVLVSTLYFGKSFSKYFKEIEGKYNSKLKFSEDQPPRGGWIFRSSEESQTKLNELLKKIYQGEIQPITTKQIMPDIDSKDFSIKVFNNLKKLLDLLPEENFSSVISENEKFSTSLYINIDEEEIDGNIIYSLVSSRKKMFISQSEK